MECFFHLGNDCAYTVGIHIGGTIENFAYMMNNKAKEMGLKDTSFANPHGLDNDNHYTTATEMALITKYAIENKYINQAMNTKSETVNFGSFSKLLTNTNALLKTYTYADGGKTGFTNKANRCLVATATKGESRYIGVVLGAETTKLRFNTTKDILEASFERYQNMDISKYLNFYINVPVEKGSIKSYERKYEDSMILPLTNEEYEGIYVKQDVSQKIVPPMYLGDRIGKIELFIEDEKIYEREIILDQNIYKKNIIDYINEGLNNMFVPFEKI